MSAPKTNAMTGGMGMRFLILMFVPALVNCGSGKPADPDAGPAGKTTLRVLAASSLTDVFADLGRAFESRNPRVRVHIATAGSQILRLQIEQGARADVLASANREHMRALIRSRLISRDEIFAANELVIAVPRHELKQERKLKHDLKNPRAFLALGEAQRIVLAGPRVPAGIYTREFLKRVEAGTRPGFRARVLSRVVSHELNVRLVLARIALGEADAGVVYRTDTAGRPVNVISIPREYNVRATYHMAVLRRTAHARRARDWIRFVLSPRGQSILKNRGFAAK